MVTVSPYYMGRIIASSSDLVLDAGDKARIDLTLHNDGNMGTAMRVYVADRPDHIRVSFSETEFNVQQDEFTNITMDVSAVSGAKAGDYEMLLVLEAATEDGGTQHVAAFNMSVLVPDLKAKLGFTGMVTIVVVAAVATALVVLWRMGRLKGLKNLRLPKRSKPTTDAGE